MSSSAYVLDAYAVMAYLQDESGADIVGEILEKASAKEIRVFMHLMNLGEVYYNVYREDGEAEANAVYATVKKYPVEFVNLTEENLLRAARIKGIYLISYADAFVVATSKLFGAKILTGDPEFKKVEDIVQIEWI